MLSNTAIPKYYAQFREDVRSGRIPVNQEISMEMNRIDELIRDPEVYYDDEAVEGFIQFCERELTLTDGSPVKLLFTFKLWAEQIFGWYVYEVKRIPDKTESGIRYAKFRFRRRLIHKQFLIIGRGAAKTQYLTFIQQYFLVVDNDTTQQITTAPTMRQSEEVMGPIRTAIVKSRGPVYKFLTFGSTNNTTGSSIKQPKLRSTKLGIINQTTNSTLEVRPMRIDKLQGLKCKVATVDEWLSGDLVEDPIGAIEQGASKNPDWLIVAVSSEGTTRNGSGDTIKMELMSILRGEYKAPHVSIWYYKLDDVKEVNDPFMWLKANPNLGQTVSFETYQNDVDKMEHVPASINDILAKRFGIPREGFTYYFTYQETRPSERKINCWKVPCAMGVDLSLGDDFCSFTYLFPLKDGRFGVKTRCYISSYTLDKLQMALRQKYEDFRNEGSLIVMEGTVLDMDVVYEDLDKFMTSRGITVMAVGYDVYNSDEFLRHWIQDNGDYNVEKVIQGSRTESVPLGELKKLAEQRALVFDQEIMSFCMGNAITLVDTNGNRKLAKRRNDQKIDAVSALMDAYVAYKRHSDEF